MLFKEKYGPYAFVAGGSYGLGGAFAEGLARRGLNLVLLARGKERLEETAERLRKEYSVDVLCRTVDLIGKGPTVIPGGFNRFARFIMARLLPRRTAINLMAKNTGDLS